MCFSRDSWFHSVSELWLGFVRVDSLVKNKGMGGLLGVLPVGERGVEKGLGGDIRGIPVMERGLIGVVKLDESLGCFCIIIVVLELVMWSLKDSTPTGRAATDADRGERTPRERLLGGPEGPE